jgi:hypothetical protein
MIRQLVMLLLVVGCAACNRTSAQSSKDQAPAVEPVAHVTIVGCVQPADHTATNTSGTNDTKFMLTHAKAGDSTNATGTSGTSGNASAPPSTAGTYRLSGSDDTLSPNVGHQVEIVAVVQDPLAAPAATMGGTAAYTPAPKVKVETIRMIAVPCPN